jgi:hypothetical protein
MSANRHQHMSSKDGVARVLPQAVQHDSDSPPALKLSESSKGEARKRAALLNDVVLRDLQILTQIPDEKAMQFRLDVQCALDIVWDDYDARAALAEPRCASRLRQIAGQAAKLQQSLMSGGAGVHRLLFAAWPNEAAVSLIDCERMCEFLAEIAADAAVGAVGGWRNRPRAAHRPELWKLEAEIVRVAPFSGCGASRRRPIDGEQELRTGLLVRRNGIA